MIAKEIEFRPARPGLRELAPVVFLGAMLAILLWQAFVNGADISRWGLAGLTALVAAGIFAACHLRFPGSPVLRVYAEGLQYARSGRTAEMLWSDLVAIEGEYTRKERRFISGRGGRPIIVHQNMVARDGRYFLELIEDYWEAPEP